ncbi:uncharacterized protein BJX67DRAFT_382554 [Aspergillus lucknowensis]|uniref:Oxidoreductase acuF-like C2H2 type zinc-finger domain-containing protein n=1 Tax=Aspergillus lucknowensis TaxID=176173 RepID=A0ABR4LN71_9EURO
MSTISDLTRSCLKQLNELISSDALAQSQNAVPLRAWKDELGRLRLWAGNIGAHQTGQSSLDYRLRDASHIKGQTIKILEAIKKLLAELQNTLSGEKEDEEDDQLDEDLQSLVAELVLENPSDSALTVQEAYDSLVNKVSQLFDISMTVRKPAQHDRLIGTEKGDAEPFKFNFHQHVSHKYPQAENLLVDRISSAMARQRAILKYRERHHLKLSQGLHIDEAGDNTTVRLSETVASTFKLEAPGQTTDDLMSNSDASFTSYAGSLLSGGEKLAIPALPKEAAGRRPFECPYCYFIITVKDRQAWARHIFRDLSPYICIFSGCSTQNKLYESRKAWYRHIRQAHMANQDVRGSYTCSLCAEGSLPMVSFEKHVGRHLEELSLFVLPRDTEDDEVLDDESGYGESENGESEDGGQETESDVERARERVRDHLLRTQDDIVHAFHNVFGTTSGIDSEGGKIIGVRASEDGPIHLDGQDTRHKNDMSVEDDLQKDNPDPTEGQDSHLVEPQQPDAQTTSSLDVSDPGNFGNEEEITATIRAAVETAGFEPDLGAPESTHEPEARGRRRSVGESSNPERPPRARDRARSRHAAAVSASPSRTRPFRQDLELLRRREEIERLKRELARHRERLLSKEEEEEEVDISVWTRRLARRLEEIKHAAERRGENPQVVHLVEDEEDSDEPEITNICRALRRLGRYEEAQRVEEEKAKAERRSRLQRLEAEEAIERLRLEEEEEQIMKEGFKRRLRDESGYTEEEIEDIVSRRAKRDEEREKQHSGEIAKKDKGREEDEQQHHNTWIKVHRKYLLPETLNAYNLPWDWAEDDTHYIIIKQWINEDLQEKIFEHTQRLREDRLHTLTSGTSSELKSRDGTKGKTDLERKKNPGRRSWIFT